MSAQVEISTEDLRLSMKAHSCLIRLDARGWLTKAQAIDLSEYLILAAAELKDPPSMRDAQQADGKGE